MSEYGFCPLLKRDCIGPKCAWFVYETNACSIAEIAERLRGLEDVEMRNFLEVNR